MNAQKVLFCSLTTVVSIVEYMRFDWCSFNYIILLCFFSCTGLMQQTGELAMLHFLVSEKMLPTDINQMTFTFFS